MTNSKQVMLGVSLVLAVACDPASGSVEPRDAILGPIDAPRGAAPPGGQRWVLRDADGVAVDAVVEPTCRGNSGACVISEIGAVGELADPECVRVIRAGDQHLDLRYALADGRAESCAGTYPAIGAYAEADCTGPFYAQAGLGVESASRWTRLVKIYAGDGLLYYESTADAALTPDFMYSTTGGCHAVEVTGSWLPWLPVPDWAVDLLGQPPYSLSWE